MVNRIQSNRFLNHRDCGELWVEVNIAQGRQSGVKWPPLPECSPQCVTYNNSDKDHDNQGDKKYSLQLVLLFNLSVANFPGLIFTWFIFA